MRVTDPVAYFEGTWNFDRTVEDRSWSAAGTACGTAEFSPEEDGLRWRESGRLEIGEVSTPASRTLLIKPDLAAGGWMVRFEDGRPFHALHLDRDRRCEVDHPCAEDHYRGWIEAETRDLFRTSWVVEGPRKDQLIRTSYQRIGRALHPDLD